MNNRAPENSGKSMNMEDAKQTHLNWFAVLAAFDLFQRKSQEITFFYTN
jgi:hypothetical protein